MSMVPFPGSAVAYGTTAEEMDSDRTLHARIDMARTAMEGEIMEVRQRCRAYLSWYSPEWNAELGTHDAWTTPINDEDIDLTRSNFNISRATVDIWTALEASAGVNIRAEPNRIAPPMPSLDENDAQRHRLVYDAMRTVESYRATARGAEIRRWHKKNNFLLNNYKATRKKNLYGFAWAKVVPDFAKKRPVIHLYRDPTLVYPIWSSTDPGDAEMILVAYQKNAMWANAKWGLGLTFSAGRVDVGMDNGVYQSVNDRSYDRTRTMVWVEELWWAERTFDRYYELTSTVVHCAYRVAGRIVEHHRYPGWLHVPFVYYENTDERDSYGWSDIANVIDINDEFNRRLSQEGDIIGIAASPRYQMLGSVPGRQVDMPESFELIPLQDQERIEQILTHIDLFPTQQHFNVLMDLLHRVSGLPPIVWGLIANAQTSGRALTASWKATEARLAPKLMRNEQSHRRHIEIEINYAKLYDWRQGAVLFANADGSLFDDLTLLYPPMEPRDFQEVTMNAITKRDAGIITTEMAMRETGDDAPEDTLELVLAENMNIALHPDKVNAYLLAKRAELDNTAYAQQLEGQAGAGGLPANATQVAANVTNAVAAAPAAPPPGTPPVGPGPLPPTQPGAAGNAGQAAPGIPPGPGGAIEGGTLARNGNVSGQLLQKSQFG